MEPPPCIQNAMMTKDKKPFTYTPGGLNLNEIKSPRMARRIEKNAAYEGVGSTPTLQNRTMAAPACLPPSAIAAMQPQMHVQVFPSGPPPPPPMSISRGGAPPPPPPISNIPPPPPPPTQPLPTQKVRTADQQIVERPDMTKIIPENPMSLLKKTVGPKIKNTLLEELYRNPEKPLPQQVPMATNVYQSAPQSPKPQNVPYEKDVLQTTPTSNFSAQTWSPPIIERKESTRNANQQPERTVNVGCIYIPPINAQQNRNITSPTHSVSSPKVQSPGTPTLKEAPKPWQQKQHVKQEETPQWTRREASISPSPNLHDQYIQQPQRPTWPQPTQNVQQQRFQAPRPQQTSQKQPVHLATVEPTYQEASVSQRNNPGQFEPRGVYTEKVLQPQFDPSSHPNAVFVTQPIVLQHPGANYGPPVINKRENVNVKQEIGVRTIPVQIEGRETPNINRNLNRQQSWSNSPTQSGSFKVIQKITGTDGEEEDNIVTEHMPRYPQQFSPEQIRKMQLNDSDQELLNRFRQVPTEEGHKKPQIRNIPIQIEGDNVSRNRTYVPPSQQVPAEEPKKYTGGSIPSRSFKMLQAMTAPDSCANVKEANETNEHYDFPYQGNNWTFSPAYPMYHPQPFWPPYHPPNPYKLPSTEHSNSDPELNRASDNKTPGPYFGYPAYTPTRELEQKPMSRTPSSFSRCSSSTELENINWGKTPIPYPMYSSSTTPVPNGKTPKPNSCDSESGFKTPVPFWYGYSPTNGQEKSENKPGNNYNYYPPFPLPYYDPYYYPYYYYGYPPMFSPLPYMIPANDQDDYNGYSSMDEMAFYDQKTREPNTMKKFQCKPHISPETLVTPTPDNISEPQKTLSSSESDTETETNELIQEQVANSIKLQNSHSDINVYQQSDNESEVSEVEEDTDNSSNSSVYEEEREEEVVPHQLSVIFEVSEVTDTSRQARESSVISDCTTVEGIRSDDEEVDDISTKQWISGNLAEIASRIQSRINARIELDESEVYSSFTMKTPSPRRETFSTINEDNIRNQEVGDIENKEDLKTATDLQEKTDLVSNMDNCENSPAISQIQEDVIPLNQALESDRVRTTDTFKIQSNETEEETSKESSDSEDWWGVIGKKEDEYPRRNSSINDRDTEAVEIDIENDGHAPIEVTPEYKCSSEKSKETKQNVILYRSITKEDDNIDNGTQREMGIEEVKKSQQNSSEDDVFNEEYEETIPKLEITSAHSSRSSASSRKISSDSDDSSDSENSESSEDNVPGDQNYQNNNIEDETIVIPSIKDRIRALQECISVKKKPTRMDEEMRVNVKSHVESIDSGEPIKSKPISAKSSVKSFDEISEEDSGVTDLSKQYSDNEEFPELRKMSKYQRASTHSRLFQLLQEECENEGEEEVVEDIETRKTQLSLPLTSDVNDKLADELVHSMLRQKKGQIFRNMSVDKLHAAARKVLQEEGDSFDTPSEGFSDYLSPLRNDTGNSTPQEFYGHYNEYMQYYDSWAQAAANQDIEILKSKTHKLVQDVGQKTNFFPVISAKCPRVLSGITVHSDLKNLTESAEEPSSLKNPDPKS